MADLLLDGNAALQRCEPETEHEKWNQLAPTYDEDVYSLTKYPEKRKRIIDAVRNNTKILIAGGGSAVYLQQNILEENDNVSLVLSDFSSGMLETSSSRFSDNSLTHLGADTTKLPFREGSFDTVVSTNSIIAETRESVLEMFKSIFQSLKIGGEFVAYLPSYEAANDFSLTSFGSDIELDPHNYRVWDTTGWQCFHTQKSVREELEKAGFTDIEILKVGVDSINEVNDLNNLYGSEQAALHFREHFVVAKKQVGTPEDQEELPKLEDQRHWSTFGSHIKMNNERIKNNDFLRIQNLTSKEITPEVIDLVTKLYKEIFDNKGHFLFNPKIKKFFSPSDIFGKKQFYTFDELTQLPLGQILDPITGDPLVVYHDPEKLREIIQVKFSEDVYLSLIGESGFTFATYLSLEKARQTEGWADSLCYSNYKGPREIRSKSNFYSSLNKVLWKQHDLLNVPKGTEFSEESKVLALNAIGIHPEARGKKAGKRLADALINFIPKNIMQESFDVSESTFGEKVVGTNKSGKTIFVPGILNDSRKLSSGDSVITIDKLSNYF